MEGCNLDTIEFIDEIRKRPVLWDQGNSDHKNKDKRNESWDELVDHFFDVDDSNPSERAEFRNLLGRRWKSLRDCYNREILIQRKRKESGKVKRAEYLYFNELSFLRGVVRSRVSPEPSTTADERSNSPDLPRTSRSLSIAATSAMKRKQELMLVRQKLKKKEDREEESKNDNQREERDEVEPYDSDKMFLLSLLGPLRRIPEDARFGAKRRLMEVLDEELQMHTTTTQRTQPKYEFIDENMESPQSADSPI